MTEFSTFKGWLHNHGCTKDELWKIQNCLGSLLGFDHPFAKEASEAWRNTLEECCECGEKDASTTCSHCLEYICDICTDKNHGCSPDA